MADITWNITDLQRAVDSGVVTTCYWEVSNETKTFNGACTLNKPDVTSPSFIPYESLSKETVLGWLFNLLGDEKEVIANKLSEEPTTPPAPAFEKGLPW